MLSFLTNIISFFHYVFVDLSRKKLDLVIANILSNLSVPYVSDLTFFISYWNQSVNNFIDSIIMLSNKVLSKNGTMLLFHFDDLRVLNEI